MRKNGVRRPVRRFLSEVVFHSAAAPPEVERVGVGQEEEEGELEKSASVASRRGIGREIVLNGDTFLLIW